MEPEMSSQAESAHREQVAMGRIARTMPFVISALFHVGLFLVMLCIIAIATPPPAVGGDIVLSDTVYTDEVPPNYMESPLAKETPKNPSQTRRLSRSPKPTLTNADPGTTAEPLLKVIGTGGARTGDEGGEVLGSPVPPGGPFRPVRLAANFIYVIDCSGSMIDTFDKLRYEMLRSIGRHRWEKTEGRTVHQSFHVILFTDGRPMEAAPRRLVPATRQYKQAAAKFLEDVRPERQTDPIPALKRAFEVLRKAPPGPSVIYLLTDGEFPDPQAVHRFLAAADTGRPVQIHTTLYGFRDAEGAETLQTIAKDHHGQFTFVPYED